MDFNFEDFSFRHGDILNETKDLSEPEKIEFLIGYIKDLTDSYDKLFEVSGGLLHILNQSKEAIRINLDSMSKIHEKLVALEEFVDVQDQLISTHDKMLGLHSEHLEILGFSIDTVSKTADMISDRLDLIDP